MKKQTTVVFVIGVLLLCSIFDLKKVRVRTTLHTSIKDNLDMEINQTTEEENSISNTIEDLNLDNNESTSNSEYEEQPIYNIYPENINGEDLPLKIRLLAPEEYQPQDGGEEGENMFDQDENQSINTDSNYFLNDEMLYLTNQIPTQYESISDTTSELDPEIKTKAEKETFAKKDKILNKEIKRNLKKTAKTKKNKKQAKIIKKENNEAEEDQIAAKFISDTISKATINENEYFNDVKGRAIGFKKLSDAKSKEIEQEAMETAENIISQGRALADALELSGIAEALESAMEESSQHEAEMAKKGIVIGSLNLKGIINSQIKKINPTKIEFLKKKNKKTLKKRLLIRM